MLDMGDELNIWITTKYQNAGWSMRELARRAGLSHGSVSGVLSGKQEPGAKFYYGMAKAFGVPVAAIERLDAEGIEPAEAVDNDTPLSFAEWQAILSQLSAKQRAELILYALKLLATPDDDESAAASPGRKPAPQPSK